MSNELLHLEAAEAEFDLKLADDGRSVSGNLRYGVVYNGQAHYGFTMRLLTVRDDMAVDADLKGQERLLARYALALEKLGDLPADTLTADFLADSLVSSDFDALFYAQELMLKKRERPLYADTAKQF